MDIRLNESILKMAESKEYAFDAEMFNRHAGNRNLHQSRNQLSKTDASHPYRSRSCSVPDIFPTDDSTVDLSNLQRCLSSSEVRVVWQRSRSDSLKNDKAASNSDSISQTEEDNENTKKQFSSSCIECVKPYPVLNRDDLSEGDHIIRFGALYDHHAIVVGIAPDESDENNQKKAKLVLIHATNSAFGASIGVSKSSGGKAKISQTEEYFDFEKYKIMIVIYFNAPFNATQVVRRAQSEHQKQNFGIQDSGYHLFRNNCEHFATFCVTNERFSVQVMKLSMILRMFFSRGFRGLSDEKLRNEVAHERNLICKLCFERNEKLFEAEKKCILKKTDVQNGDIITFSYWNLHHDAIVVKVHEGRDGKRNEVDLTYIHYAFCGPFKYRTIKEERGTFPLNGSVTVTMYKSPQFNVYSPDEVVKRARSRIGEQQFAFFSNDSCHLARWCKLKLSRAS